MCPGSVLVCNRRVLAGRWAKRGPERTPLGDQKRPPAPTSGPPTDTEDDTMRVNKLTIAALAVVAGLSLTACQNDDVAAAGDTPAASPTAAGTGGQDGRQGNDASTGGSDGNDQAQGSVAGTGSNQNGEVGECRTDELEVSAVEGAGGDDEGLVAVEFVNEGGRDCSLVGYAGVDLKTNSGTVSAERTGEEAETIILKDGESVSFAISYPINNSGGSGVKI